VIPEQCRNRCRSVRSSVHHPIVRGAPFRPASGGSLRLGAATSAAARGCVPPAAVVMSASPTVRATRASYPGPGSLHLSGCVTVGVARGAGFSAPHRRNPAAPFRVQAQRNGIIGDLRPSASANQACVLPPGR
jgi:hypothetical protein